jgi:hypothetical protein
MQGEEGADAHLQSRLRNARVRVVAQPFTTVHEADAGVMCREPARQA